MVDGTAKIPTKFDHVTQDDDVDSLSFDVPCSYHVPRESCWFNAPILWSIFASITTTRGKPGELAELTTTLKMSQAA